MNAKKKINLISEILDRYDDGVCFYCGSILNGDMEAEDFDEGYPEDWCPDCGESIDPDNDWEEACLLAIDKIINDKKFEP
ncbi:MAG: hypothetical protein ACFE9V_07130 [Candidatus Hodarchaeota archaeon]